MGKRLRVALIGAASLALVIPAGSAVALNPDTLVTVGSPSAPFSAKGTAPRMITAKPTPSTVPAAGV